MSNWLDNIKLDLTIATGDGKKYTVDWMCATFSDKSKEYCMAEFVFKGVSGSLPYRGNPKGTVYNLEFYIQGTDNLDTAAAFWKSADNKKHWTISHPFYGNVYVQPFNLAQDNAGWNVSKFTGKVMETNAVKQSNSVPAASADSVAAAAAQAPANVLKPTYVNTVAQMKPSDLQTLANDINGVYKAVTAKISAVQADVNAYTDAYNQANAVLNTAIYDTDTIISQSVALIMTPAGFTDSVINRVNMFNNMLAVYATDIQPILNILSTSNINTAPLKLLYETNAATAIAGLCVATVTGITNDYNYRPDILATVAQVIGAYNGYLDNLALLQTPNGGQVNSYLPNPDNLVTIKSLVNDTVNALFVIYAGAKQQRTLTLAYDSNVILVANQVYGILPDDSTVQAIIDNNNITGDELFGLKAGKQIIYYV